MLGSGIKKYALAGNGYKYAYIIHTHMRAGQELQINGCNHWKIYEDY